MTRGNTGRRVFGWGCRVECPAGHPLETLGWSSYRLLGLELRDSGEEGEGKSFSRSGYRQFHSPSWQVHLQG